MMILRQDRVPKTRSRKHLLETTGCDQNKFRPDHPNIATDLNV